MTVDFSNAQRAEVLTQALPYIQKYRGKIIVVKYGGNAMIDPQLMQQVMDDIVLLWLVGVKVVMVHGGGPEINELMNRLGKKPEFVDGLRVTDKETIDIVQMVLAGKVNKNLVSLLERSGGAAMGISGVDGNLIQVKQKDPRLGFVGAITHVNIQPVMDLLEKGYIPVISTVGRDAEGNAYNINGDTAAGWIAGALKAERLLMMTDISGIMMDPKNPESQIPQLTVSQAKELFVQKVVTGGMIPKVECCMDAISMGVQTVTILDGRIPHSILMELFTNEGAGTLVTGDEV